MKFPQPHKQQKKWMLGGLIALIVQSPFSVSQDKTPITNEPRPTPVTRPEMKRLLEAMKERTERIPLPPISGEEALSSDPRATSYEGRLGQLFLPATAGARSYLNVSGSPRRAQPSTSTNNRPPLEEDKTLTLDYGFKTRLFWIASRANNCQYCLGHQESKLLAVGMLEDQIASLDSNWTLFPVEEQTAFALARTLTLEPQLIGDQEIDRCRKYYSDLQILEMVLSVSGNNAINRWKEGVGVPQSSSGGNFGSSGRESTTQHAHSYLTETSAAYSTKNSKVIAQSDLQQDLIAIPTKFIRKSSSNRRSTQESLVACSTRNPRFPLSNEERTREVLGELAPKGPIPAWMKLLANFPVAGKRQVASLLTAEKELALSPILRGQMAWVIAHQNGAWYSLAEANKRLIDLGQSPEQISQLEKIDESAQIDGLTPKDHSLLILAKNLGASPVVLTDLQVAKGVQLAGPKEVVQAVHYTAMRSLFDRFTEAAGLRSDP